MRGNVFCQRNMMVRATSGEQSDVRTRTWNSSPSTCTGRNVLDSGSFRINSLEL